MSDTQSQKQVMLLQVDDHLSVPNHSIPLLESRRYLDRHQVLASVVNFLRGGCPKVQVSWEYNNSQTWKIDQKKDSMRTQRFLNQISQPGEYFHFDTNYDENTRLAIFTFNRQAS